MIAAARYTSPVSVKAAGPGVETGEKSGALRPDCDTGVFFTPAVSPSMADRAWHPSTRWPVPDSGFLPIHDLSPIFVEKDGDGSNPQNQEPVMNPAVSVSPSPNPVLAAIAEQAIHNATGKNPMFRDEFYDRMSAVMDATELLESILAESAHHEFDLTPQRLYGMVKLINRELKTVDALIDALKTAIESNPEIQRAIPNY